MLSKLLPVVFLLAGTGIGVGSAIFLPGGSESGNADSEAAPVENSEGKKPETGGASGEFEFVQMSNPFVVPVVEDGKVSAMVVLSLSLEAKAGMREKIFSLEPKLRDNFLRVLFDHANMGGFSGAFTRTDTLDILREALLNVARDQVGEGVNAVLIVDIARQDT
jgi:flagellar protein FliL